MLFAMQQLAGTHECFAASMTGVSNSNREGLGSAGTDVKEKSFAAPKGALSKFP